MCFDDFDSGLEPYEDDLQTFSDNCAWEDTRGEQDDLAAMTEAELLVSQEDADLVRRALASEVPLEGHAEGTTIKTWTATFRDGFSADLNLINDSHPRLEAVLLDEHDHEEDVLEGSTEDTSLEGSFFFDGYTLTVRVEEPA